MAELLATVQAEQAALTPYHHTALTDLHAVTGLGALFDTLLVFENYPVDLAAMDLPGGPAVADVQVWDAAHYPLRLVVVPGTRLRITLDHRPDLLDRPAVERIAQRLHRLLPAMAADPQRPVARLDLLTTDERERVLTTWNGTAHPVPDTTLPALIERQAARTPRPRPWRARTAAGRTRNSTPTPTGWRTCWPSWARGRRRRSVSPCPARRSSWSRCWPC